MNRQCIPRPLKGRAHENSALLAVSPNCLRPIHVLFTPLALIHAHQAERVHQPWPKPLRVKDQAAWNRSTHRAGEHGGARSGRPRCVRILTTTAGSSMAEMIFRRPPQFGQCSISKTRLSKRAQLMRAGVPWACRAACALVLCALGTTAARNLALGASTPWKRIRCKRGRSTSGQGAA